MERLLELRFIRSEQSYDDSKYLRCTYKMKFTISNLSNEQIGLVNFRLFGQAREDLYHPQFTAVKCSAPKRLNGNSKDDLWLIASDDSFPRFEKHKKLYLVARVSDSTGRGIQKCVFEFQSKDWLDDRWTVAKQYEYSYYKESEAILKDITQNILREQQNKPCKDAGQEMMVTDDTGRIKHISSDSKTNQDAQEKIVPENGAGFSGIKKQNSGSTDKEVKSENNSKCESERISGINIMTEMGEEERGLFGSMLDPKTIRLSVLDTELKNATDDKEYFMLWIEIENKSDEIREFSFQNFNLQDCDRVNLKYSGFVDGNEPSDVGIAPDTKDRFYVAFSAGKTKHKDLQLTLAFNVIVAGYDEGVSVVFQTNSVDDTWIEKQHKLVLPQLQPNEKKIEDKIKYIESSMIESLRVVEKEYGVEFKNVGLAKNDNRLTLRGIVRSVEKRRCSLLIAVVALNSQEKAVDQTNILVCANDNTWKAFDKRFCAENFNKIFKLIVVPE